VTEAAIKVEDLRKKFSREQDDHRSDLLREVAREILGRPAPTPDQLRSDEFWAVNNVSFDVAQGESVALIGRNGCGKTTTLRMIAGLIKPDAGRIAVCGRVQALIALGTGFNLKLSGRDNIVNNAAIQGYSSRQARELVDEIVMFSEIEDFIDAPVSTYSSGMKARLGFSCAVHLNPDILIIDEILGVGDFPFQNKCFAHIRKMQAQGVTILLVSHSHNKVMQICDRAIWLDKGEVRAIGDAKQTVSEYLGFLNTDESLGAKARMDKKRGADDRYGPVIKDAEVVDQIEVEVLSNGCHTERIQIHSPMSVVYRFYLKNRVRELNVSLNLYHEDGAKLTTASTLNGDLLVGEREGWVECCVDFPVISVSPGRYVWGLAIHEGHSYLYRDTVAWFSVIPDGRLTWGPIDLNPSIRVSRKLHTGGAHE